MRNLLYYSNVFLCFTHNPRIFLCFTYFIANFLLTYSYFCINRLNSESVTDSLGKKMIPERFHTKKRLYNTLYDSRKKLPKTLTLTLT